MHLSICKAASLRQCLRVYRTSFPLFHIRRSKQSIISQRNRPSRSASLTKSVLLVSNVNAVSHFLLKELSMIFDDCRWNHPCLSWNRSLYWPVSPLSSVAFEHLNRNNWLPSGLFLHNKCRKFTSPNQLSTSSIVPGVPLLPETDTTNRVLLNL